ncbi:nuclear pore membrane glycoprotein 210-like [Mytilus trossulus]|uniref:nuclear pore membrane glycoprotein 210-like n=1 Tax=Mytilus trossulus TaxID=6551 RepID=UPI0030045B27
MAAASSKRMAAIFNMKIYFLTILTLFLFITSTHTARLSDPKILLPYHSSAIVNYTLHVNLTRDEVKFADSSCFTWSTNTPETASLTLVNSTDGECAFSAIVSVMSKSPHRKQAIIMTENKVTGEKLKCIVIVKAISQFEIQTTTRALYLEDSPEELIIQGYDDAGNVFSSLAGLEFEWSLLSDAEKSEAFDAYNILRILQFFESDYSAPEHIRQIEDRGVQGDIILVEGIRTGSAKVKARIKDAAYKDVPTSIVKIMVVANLNIKPTESYVLMLATVKYTVELVKATSIIEINMPSPQFLLEVQDSMICTLDASTSTATALELGSTEIVLTDKNIKENDSLTKPTAMLYVVTASYLAFVVLPHRKWVLETGRQYEILIELYDKDSHRIHPSDNIIIEAAFPSNYFKLHYSTKNGTYHTVTTLQKGKTNIDGALTTIIRKDGSEYAINPVIKQSQDVEIYDPIKVNPPLLYFPWDPVKETNHRYQLKATGGSGDYIWSSNNLDTTSVNVRGEITTSNLGKSIVTAADTRNQAHKGSSTIHVLPPSKIEFIPKRVEAMVDTELELPLAVFGLLEGRQVSFNDCRKMRLNVTLTDDVVFSKVKGSSLPEEGCRTIKVKAAQKGHTQVKASYVYENIKLESTVTIAAYDPLVPIDPEKEAVVTIGSLKEVIFTGGPQPWVLDTSKYFQDMSEEKEEIVNIEKVKLYGNTRGLHSFYVTCEDFGVQKLTLKVGNEKTAKNQYPAEEQASIRFSCAAPVEIHLQPSVGYTEGLPPCPINSREVSQPIPVHCRRDLDILITVTDSNGRKFDNFSSLVFDWTLSDQSLASFSDSIVSSVETVHGIKLVNSYKKLVPVGKTGQLSVTGTVTYYSDDYLKKAGSTITNRIYPRLTKTIDIRLVDEAVLTPSIISIFNHPSNKVTIVVEKGSGYFYVVPEQRDIVSVDYQEKDKRIQINPLKDGSLSLTVYDLCITMPQPLTASVYVSGVGSVLLSVIDKMEVDHEVKARVKVMDVHNKPLRASFFSLMDLKLIPASNIVTVRPDPDTYIDEFTAVYILYGAQVGHTTLHARAHPQTGVVRSQSKPVEVFPPLQLIPKNITLITGALFQVLSKGGPTPQCTVQFSIKNSKVSSVSRSGVLEAMELGSTVVIGQAVGQDPETGETVVYSQDDAIVNVIQLSEIKIFAPLSRLETGTQMPMYAVGQTDQETPFTFGAARPPLTFTWSVNNKNVVILNNVFHKSNIKPVDESNFATQLFAKSPGQVTVKLTVRPQRNSRSQILKQAELTDELQIQVYQKMEVLSPKICDGKLLISPNSDATVKTNRDGSARMSYQVLSANSDKAIITVKDGGVITSGASCGEAHLQITAFEEFGTNQTVVLLIKVKTVAYMMINSNTALRTNSGQLKKIPVGVTLQLSVSYHDDVGEEFFATNVKMYYRLNRYDLVQIGHGSDNNTLVMKAAEVGQTVLKVWDKHSPWIADYINIDVDYAITPNSHTVFLGQIVCYTSSLVTETGYNGVWQNNNNNVKITSDSGIAVATKVGSSLITYEISSGISTYTEVTIEPIKSVTFDTPLTFLTNVKGRSSGYFIPVRLGDGLQGNTCYGKVLEGDFHPDSIPFSCQLSLTEQGSEISIDDLFSVFGIFDSKTGQYGCQLEKQEADKMPQQISTMTSNIRLLVRVPFQDGQSEVISETKQFELYPAFFVQTSEIHLSTVAAVYPIRISSIPTLAGCIKAVVSDSSILEALEPEQDTQSKSVLYPIKLLDSAALWDRETLDMSVNMICAKTGQEVKVPVSIRLIGQKPEYLDDYGAHRGWTTLIRQLFNNYPYWLFMFFMIFTTALLALLGFHYLFGKKYTAVPNAVFIPGPAGASSPYNIQNLSGSPPAYSPAYSPSKSQSTYLWSPGYHPQDGSSSGRRRSPYMNRPVSPM